MADGNAIHSAINNGYFQQIRFLIDRGVDINGQDSQGRTPLILCSLISSTQWSIGLARLLLEHEARISKCDRQGFNALHHACVNQRNDLVEVYLAALDCDIHSKCKQGNTSLHYAAALGNRSIIKALSNLVLKYKLTLDPKNKKGFTPLHQAFKANQVDGGDLLIQLGADCTLPTADFESKTAIKLRQEAVERLQLIDKLKKARKSSRTVKQIKRSAETEKPQPRTMSIPVAKDFDLRNNPEYMFKTSAVNYFNGKDNSAMIKRPQTASDRTPTVEAWKEEIVGLWELYETRFSKSYRTPATPLALPLHASKSRSDSVASSGGLTPQPSRRNSKVNAKSSRSGSVTLDGGTTSRRSSVTGRRSNGMLPLVKTQSRTSFALSGTV